MNTTNDEERRDIEDLLPWYVAGTLDRRDMRARSARFNAAASCKACASMAAQV